MYKNLIKPILGTLICLVGFIVLSPFMFILIIAISLESPGGAFFTQKRVGKNKKHFTLYKFRTMRNDAPANTPTHLLSDPDFYITKSGRFMRRFSLDEFPQLINVIKGDMALVGPRPALWNQYDLIAERDKHGANDIRPGITGLAQVKGRDELPIAKKAQYDGSYAKNVSILFDIWVLFQTVVVVFKARGVKEGNK
ncbi:MAG: sugar transferase [Clostridiales bacterium]|nr:sugar transferase [Clostridiales bacterium]